MSGSLFLTYIIAFLLIFGWALLFPAYSVVSSEYIGTSALQAVLFFINNLIPITSTAILLAYSLFIKRDSRRLKKTAHAFTSIVSPVVVFLIVLTMGYTAAIIWLQPIVEKKIEENLAQTTIAHNFFEKAKKAYLDKDYMQASIFIKFSLTADPQGKEALALERSIRRYVIAETEKPKKITPKKSPFNHEEFMEEQNAERLMDKAWYFYNRENFYSAYYYATLAQKLDPRRTDARELSVKSLNKMKASELSAADTDLKSFYKRKHEGYTAMLNRDYIAAYYIFYELSKSYPNDTDVAEYLKKSVRFVSMLSFFSDEVDDIDSYPGTGDIVFINRETPSTKEFVYIGKMIELREGIYFRNIESMIIGAGGTIISHMKADYGKYAFIGALRTQTESSIAEEAGEVPVVQSPVTKNPGGTSQDYINLNCIDRVKPGVRSVPMYIVGSGANDVFAHFISLVPSISNLKHYRISGQFISTANWMELLAHRLTGAFERRGYDTFDIDCSLIANAILPFAFLVLALFSISIGWIFRSRYSRKPPLLLLLCTPIIPFVFAFFTNLYLYMSKAIAGFVLMLVGFLISLLVLCIIQGITIIVAFFFIAGKFAD
jgi:hypothetical protein